MVATEHFIFISIGVTIVGTTLTVGSQASDFVLRDQDGNDVHFADRLGKHVIVLYFYPKDFSGGCTAEACAFRDSYEDFTGVGADVIGVSVDTPESQKDFATRHRLPFTLLSDPGNKVAQLYGLSKTLGILPSRSTFVIDRQGIIRHIFESLINVGAHIEAAKKIVLDLEQEKHSYQ